MAANFKKWQEQMPAIFELILCKIDRIVDDTSLEKLLELMAFSNKDLESRSFILSETTLEFLKKVQHSSDPRVVAFGLRLTGILGSTEEGFDALTNSTTLSSNSLLYTLFQDKKQLWSNAGVRDSYFKSVAQIINVYDGVWWSQKAGCVEHAMGCLTDSSIFVAEYARKFIAKYLVVLYNNRNRIEKQEAAVNGTEPHCHRGASKSLQNEDTMCITCIASYIDQLIRMPPYGLERTMMEQVSAVQLLHSLMEANPLVGQEIIHQHRLLFPCLQLLQSANKNDCGRVVDVLVTLMNNTRKWNINWEVLLNAGSSEVLNILLEFAFVLFRRSFTFLAFKFTQGLFAVPCTSEHKDLWLCSLFAIITFPLYGSLNEMITQEEDDSFCLKKAAKMMLSATFTRDQSYKTLNGILKGVTKAYLFSSSISNSVLVTTELLQMLAGLELSQFPQLLVFIEHWCCDILTFIANQVDGTGDHLTRQCVKALMFAIEHGYLINQALSVTEENVGSTNEMKTFCLLLKLFCNRSDSQLLTGCLDCMKALFSCANYFKLSCYINEDVDNVNLGVLLRRHFSNTCWEVKDSVLTFLKHVISSLDGDKTTLICDFLLHHKLFELVWTSKDDTENYIRTSFIELVGVISSNTSLWRTFCDAISCSETMILHSILDSFLQDESAFPRRAIIKLLSFWLDTSHNITYCMLNDRNPPSLETRVADVLDKACEDFDWEVKLCALEFWQVAVKYFGTEGATGYAKIVVTALLDCDKPVKRKGLDLAKLFQDSLRVDNITNHDSLQSFNELEEYIVKQDQTNGLFESILTKIDVSRLVAGLDADETSVLSDPLPFLKDILLATMDNHENLLDCY